MTATRFLSATGFALCCFAAASAYGAGDTPNIVPPPGYVPDYSGYTKDYPDATLDKVIPGQTTKAQVTALLGQPWRTTIYGEPGEDAPGQEAPEVWEWRGRDSTIGPYRVHIEFNAHDITTNIAKIPESTGMAPARVAPAAPKN
jgi:hypothetical protein